MSNKILSNLGSETDYFQGFGIYIKSLYRIKINSTHRKIQEKVLYLGEKII